MTAEAARRRDAHEGRERRLFFAQLEGTENRISQARRDYNAIATSYNVNIKQFPRNLIAGLFGFHDKQLFQANTGARQAPNVNLDVNVSPTP